MLEHFYTFLYTFFMPRGIDRVSHTMATLKIIGMVLLDEGVKDRGASFVGLDLGQLGGHLGRSSCIHDFWALHQDIDNSFKLGEKVCVCGVFNYKYVLRFCIIYAT